MKISLKILVTFLIFLTSCTTEMEKQNAIFLAEIRTPMGRKCLQIYKDHTFKFESRRLFKSTFYEGRVSINGNELHFDYKNAKPDFGDKAVIDGIFLTYTDGIYRELLEISINEIK